MFSIRLGIYFLSYVGYMLVIGCHIKCTFIQENAALCDEIAKVQENIQIVKDERKFLLCKLLEHENKVESSQFHYKGDVMSISNGSKTKPKKRRSQEEPGKTLVP